MKKLEICRKDSVMKIIIEHDGREFPRGEGLIGFSRPLEVYTKLFQNYIDGLDYDSHIPTCTSVDSPIRKIIQQNVFLFQNLLDILVYFFLTGWKIPKKRIKIIHIYRGLTPLK